MRRSKRKSTSTYATVAGARQSKTRKDVPVPVTEHLPHVDTLSRSIPNPSIAKNAADVETAQNTNLKHTINYYNLFFLFLRNCRVFKEKCQIDIFSIYDFKIEVVPFIINFSTELIAVVKFEV
jgi:hypothetical protein